MDVCQTKSQRPGKSFRVRFSSEGTKQTSRIPVRKLLKTAKVLFVLVPI